MLIQRALDYEASKRLVATVKNAEHCHAVSGGYMKYDKSIAVAGDQYTFVKQQPTVGDVSAGRYHDMYTYLEKEAGVMAHLRTHGFNSVPATSLFHNGQLLMDALRTEDGWEWQASPATFDAYLQGVLAALKELETTPLPTDAFSVEPSYESIVQEGWRLFNYETFTEKAEEFFSHLTQKAEASARAFVADIPELQQIARTPQDPEEFVFCHLDMRQENLAWHPEKGVRIIDWSWAGPGLPGSDATSLLIDLYKSGHDVSRYATYINPQHCLNLMGFWLAHSILPNEGAEGLRLQQFASALSAYALLTAAKQ